MKSKLLLKVWLCFVICISIKSQAVTITSVQVTTSRCQASGSATVTATGGTMPYLYSINVGGTMSPQQSSNILSSLPPGTHTVYVTDALNNSASSVINITGNYQLLDFALTSTAITCTNSDGSIQVNHVAGTGRSAYTYELVAPSPVTRPAQASSTFTGLPSGNYFVRMNDSCGNFQTRNINVAAPDISFQFYQFDAKKVGCDVFTVTYNITDAAIGSSPPYTFNYTTSNGVGNATYTSSSTNPSLTFSLTGYYTTGTLTVVNSCGYTYTVNVHEFPRDLQVFNASRGCLKGYEIYTSWYGGLTYLPPYTINLTNSTGSVVATNTYSSNTVYPSMPTYFGFPAGQYTVDIVDACGSSAFVQFTWANPPAPSLICQNLPNRSCLDSSTGFSVFHYNFYPPITTKIINGPPNSHSTRPQYQHTTTYSYPYTANNYGSVQSEFYNLAAGNYTLISSDTCGNSLTYTYTVLSSEIESMSHQISYTKSCTNNNSISIELTRSGVNYGYPIPLYNNSFSLTTIPSNSLIIGNAYPGLQTDSAYKLNFLLSGTYVAKLDYRNPYGSVSGFTASCPSIIDTIVIPPYTNPAFKSVYKGHCSSNFIIQSEADTTKGVGPYSYSIISGPQTYPPQSTGTFTFSAPGTYNLLVSDACGNSYNENVTLSTANLDVLFTGAACTGNTIKLHATTSPFFTYKWVRPNNSTFNGDTLTAGPITTTDYGTYTIYQYININGCKDTVLLTKTLSPSSSPTVSSAANVCSGSSVTLTATGATSYTWNPSVTLNNGLGSSVTASPSTSTIYTVISIDANFCIYTTTKSITTVPNPTVVIFSVSNGGTICSGSTATITPGGATNYTLMPGTITGTTFTVNPTSNTTYSIKGSSSGCNGSDVVTTVTVNATPTISISSITNNGVICSGSTATITPSGATSYTLTPGSLSGTNFTVNPASSITYSITGISSGCRGNTIVTTVTVNATPTVSISSITNGGIMCSGNTVTITPNGATSYTLIPGSLSGTNFTVNPISNTTYSITGSSSGCNGNSIVTTVTVNTTPTVSISSITNGGVICSGTTATITPNGAANYTLMPGSLSGNNFTVHPASNTTYSIIGTSSGCNSNTIVTTVTVNTTPTVSIGSITNGGFICSGTTATITPSGASNYTLIPGSLSGTNFTVNPTSNTIYSITGTSSGCNGNTIVTTVTVNTTPTVSISSITNGGAICNGATATITPNGATNYTLMPGSLSGTNFTVNPASNTTYSITGSSSGCNGNSIVTTVTVNALPTISLVAFSNIKCLGTATGAATVSISGSSTYTVTWDGASTGTINTSLSSGTHTILAADVAGCSTFTTISISAPTSSLGVSIATSTTGCGLSNGSATLTPSGGWNSAYTYTISNSIPSVISNTSTATNLPAGNYGAQITDANGCVTTTGFNISNPNTSTISTTASTTTVCSGSPVILTPSGALSYTLMPGSLSATSFTVNPNTNTTYTITGTTSGNCLTNSSTIAIMVNSLPSLSSTVTNASCFGLSNGSVTLTANGGMPSYTITPNITNSLAVGQYTYTVIDNNGCRTSTIVSVAQPTVALAVIGSSISANSSCITPNGVASATVSGGTPTYTVIWSNGSTGTTVSNLNTGGPYSYTVTDANGCKASSSNSIMIPGVTGITVTETSHTNVNCFGNSTGVLSYTTSGTGPFSYTLTSTTIALNNTTGIFTALPSGIYSLLVTGAGGCIDTKITTVTQPTTALLANVSASNITPVACFGNNTGSVSVTVSGGTPSYTFSWNPAVSSNNNAATGLSGGNYTVVVTDANNCRSANVIVSISQPSSSIAASITTVVPSCSGEKTGSGTIIISGGTPNYSSVWNNGQTGNILTNVGAGIYTTHITDAHGCSYTYSLVIASETCEELFIPQLFSPNGDGLNELFTIPGIHQYPKNTLHNIQQVGEFSIHQI